MRKKQAHEESPLERIERWRREESGQPRRLITRAEEEDLLRQGKLHEVALSHLRLVPHIIHESRLHQDKDGKRLNPSQMDELLDAGLAGLLDGMDRFEKERGNRTTTYAGFYVRQRIQQARDGILNPYRFDTSSVMMNRFPYIRRFADDLGIDLNTLDEAGAAEIEKAMKADKTLHLRMTAKTIGQIVKISREGKSFSLDAPPPGGNEDGSPFSALLKAPDQDDQSDAADIQHALDKLGGTLPPPQEYAFLSYYVLGLSHGDVARSLGVSFSEGKELVLKAQKSLIADDPARQAAVFSSLKLTRLAIREAIEKFNSIDPCIPETEDDDDSGDKISSAVTDEADGEESTQDQNEFRPAHKRDDPYYSEITLQKLRRLYDVIAAERTGQCVKNAGFIARLPDGCLSLQEQYVLLCGCALAGSMTYDDVSAGLESVSGATGPARERIRQISVSASNKARKASAITDHESSGAIDNSLACKFSYVEKKDGISPVPPHRRTDLGPPETVKMLQALAEQMASTGKIYKKRGPHKLLSLGQEYALLCRHALNAVLPFADIALGLNVPCKDAERIYASGRAKAKAVRPTESGIGTYDSEALKNLNPRTRDYLKPAGIPPHQRTDLGPPEIMDALGKIAQRMENGAWAGLKKGGPEKTDKPADAVPLPQEGAKPKDPELLDFSALVKPDPENPKQMISLREIYVQICAHCCQEPVARHDIARGLGTTKEEIKKIYRSGREKMNQNSDAAENYRISLQYNSHAGREPAVRGIAPHERTDLGPPEAIAALRELAARISLEAKGNRRPPAVS